MPSLRSILFAPRWRSAWRLLLLLLFVAVTALALMPVKPKSGGLGLYHVDHVLAFFVLMAVGQRAFAGARAALGLGCGLLLYGIAIELAQSRMPGRTGEWSDLLADGLGIAAAALFMPPLLQRLAQPPVERR